MALELATAYVSLTVSARGLLDKVKAELGGPLEVAARTAGDKAGAGLGRGLAGAAKTAGKTAGKDLAVGVAAGAGDVTKALDPLAAAMKAFGVGAGDKFGSAFKAAAKGTGLDAGKALSNGIEAGFKVGPIGDELTAPLVAAAKKAGDKAGDGLSEGLQKKAKEAGKKAGDALEDGLAPRVKKAAVGLAAVFAGVQIGGFLKGAVDAAADTGEQLSKLNVLLGQSSEELDDWSKTTAEAFKISRREALTAAGTFATLFRGVGQTQPEAAAMSKALVELAGDMASFNNAKPDQVIEALGSALRGESEPIRAFGVLLDDATLKQRAFSLGLVESTKTALTPAVRVQAAYAEILAQTVVQQGDAARTSGSLANQQKELAARFNDAKAALGQGLLPIAQQIVSAISGGLLPAFEKAVPVIVEMANQVGGLGADFVALLAPVAGVAGALGTFGVGALATGFAFGQIAEGVEAAKKAFVAFQLATSTLSGGLALLGAALGGIAAVAFIAYAKNSAEAKARQEDLTTALTEAGDPAQGLVTRLDELSASLSEVKKTTAGAAEGVKSVDAFFAQATAAADDTEAAFNSVGISAQDLADVARDGGAAFGDAAQQALNLATGNSDLALATERASDAQAGMIRSLFGAREAGKITDEQLADMLNTLDKVSGAWDDTRAAQIASIKADVDKHTALKDLAFGWEAEQRAASGAKDEYGQMLFVGAQLEKELQKIDNAGRIAAAGIGTAGSTAAGAAGALSDVTRAAIGSVGGLGDATGAADDLAQAQSEAEGAAQAHEKALKGLADGVSAFVDSSFTAEETSDKWASTMARLVDQVQQSRDANDEHAASLVGNSEAALENRATMRSLVDIAQEDIQSRLQQGQTIEQVKAAAALWSAELLTNAANLGIAEGEAARYSDTILNAAATAETLNAQLSALPTDLQLNITYTLGLNAEDFRAQLIDAATAFQDELSAATVAAGIIEIPGAEIVLPRRAQGGPVMAGQAYWVGENGPEPFIPDVNGTIIANDRVSVIAGGGGGVQVGTINVTEAQSAARVVDEVNARLGWMLTTRNER